MYVTVRSSVKTKHCRINYLHRN